MNNSDKKNENSVIQRVLTLKSERESDSAFASRCGIPQSTFSGYINTGKDPKLHYLAMIAEVNGASLTWLITGKGKKWEGKLPPKMEGFRDGAPPIGKIRKIPVISWVRAGYWGEVIDPFQPGYAEDWIDTTATNNPYAFALVVDGDSMEPEFRDGDIITVDPGREAINGSYVIAKNGNKATFKQLVIDGSSVFLKPLNSRYPVKDMTGIEFKIVGVVVFKGKGY